MEVYWILTLKSSLAYEYVALVELQIQTLLVVGVISQLLGLQLVDIYQGTHLSADLTCRQGASLPLPRGFSAILVEPVDLSEYTYCFPQWILVQNFLP